MADRIHAVRGNMARLDFAPGSFDLIWCEGAAYIVGLDVALKAWKPLLRPGGAMALSEPVWLRRDRPKTAEANWESYPAMGSIDDARAKAASAGYELLGDFVLPEEAWWTNYYTPLQARVAQIAERHAGDPIARQVIEDAKSEIECYRMHSGCFGYLFLVLARS
jgi:SAM-dependent methyltransferase